MWRLADVRKEACEGKETCATGRMRPRKGEREEREHGEGMREINRKILY